ncbi:biopolymer transporter ExbD [Microcoleus sp. FACHB-1515]|uniref:ExbD/TolR family protein n=1 Tax=Cyanophyceae TaxID=3028117 RepID=UPI001688222B|nr:biopolymer transporter ExbD [Microcoleus sp. FACHB-1515]MBD2091501.1 biopolymer transporter ExbD [Microcoleus sp. FACHB-1515]
MAIRDDDLDIPPQINIVPMIDVIFAILTFFIMATLFLTRSEGLPVNLPNAQTATLTNSREQRLTVTVNEQGEVLLDRQPVTVENLAAQVRSQKGNQPEILVVINADRAVDHGTVITVMDQLRTIPGVKLGIAAKRE